MKATLKSKLDMYKSVAAHCAENFNLISAIPALLTAFNRLTGLISTIDNTTKQHAQDIRGFAIAKRKSRRALARQAATLAAKIYAYADAAGDDALKERVHFSYSILVRLKDNELPATCNIILDAATEHLAELAAYNVTADTLTSFRESIAAYKALQTNPRNALANRINYRKELKELYKSTDTLFNNQMDGIMEEYRDSQPAFFNRYISNRMIIDPPTTSTQIKGDVIDHLSRQPVEDAVITIDETVHTANTAEDGSYAMKQLQSGTYNVTVSKAGYKSQTITGVVVKRGKIVRVVFELVVEKNG